MRERGVERGGRLDQMPDDLALLGRRELALAEREVRREGGEHRELTGESLGRGDAALGTRLGREHTVGIARPAAGWHLAYDCTHLFLRAALAPHRETVAGRPTNRETE